MGNALQVLLEWLGVRPRPNEVPEYVIVALRKATARLRTLAVVVCVVGLSLPAFGQVPPVTIILEARTAGAVVSTTRQPFAGRCGTTPVAPAVVADACWWPLTLPEGTYTLAASYEGDCNGTPCVSEKAVSAAFTISAPPPTEPPPTDPPPTDPPPTEPPPPTTTCTYAVQPTALTVPLAGGDALVSVITGPGCWWDAQNPLSWATFSYGATVVGFTFTANTGAPRTGTVTVAGIAVPVSQDGTVVPPPPPTEPPPAPKVCTFRNQSYPAGAVQSFATNKGNLTRDLTALRSAGWLIVSVASNSKLVYAECPK